ncbi:MAG: helix-turn-helix domain-containing protein [Acidimicrobiia bacterium]|nr:helix-turn-helix domain-containing protein [Acidimicrobiia bacterium]
MRHSIGLHQVAERLGLHYMTVYRYVRTGKLAAHKVEGAWQVEIADLQKFQGRTEHASSTKRDSAPWSDRLEQRFRVGDLAGAWGVVEGALSSGADPFRVYTEVMSPAITAITMAVRAGEVPPQVEYIAHAVAARLVGRLGHRFARPGRKKGAVVTVTPPNDHRGLAAAMTADILRGEGFDVLEMGTDVDAASLVGVMADAHHLRAVVITVTEPNGFEAVSGLIDAVHDAEPKVRVAVGGLGLSSEEEAVGLGADLFLSSLGRLPEEFTKRLGDLGGQ